MKNNEYASIWKEAVVIDFIVLFRYSSEETEDSMKIC